MGKDSKTPKSKSENDDKSLKDIVGEVIAEKEVKSTIPLPIDGPTRRMIEEKAKALGLSRSSAIRRAIRAFCNINVQFKKEIPQRFHNSLWVLELIKGRIGDGMQQEVFLSWEDHLNWKFRQWHLARNAVKLMASMLKAIDVECFVEANVSEVPISQDSKKTKTIKEGFTVSFEFPVKEKTLDEYYDRIKRLLETTEYSDIVLARESEESKIPVSDESDKIKKEIGVDEPDK